jgi:hypothetical protein
MIATEKCCIICKTAKPLGDFYRDARRTDGRDPRCRNCTREYRKGKFYGASREYRERHRDRDNAAHRRRHAANPEVSRQRQREYRASKKGWAVCKLSDIRKRSPQRDVVCELTYEDIYPLMVTHCPVLGIELQYGGKRCDATASIDRVIPSLGYVPGNVVVISDRANRIKNDATLAELEALVAWMNYRMNSDYEVRTS